MRIVLINGSPKVNGSASGILLEDFRKKVTEAGYPGKKNGEAAGEAAETDTEAETGRTVFSQTEIAETGLHTASVSGEAMKELDGAYLGICISALCGRDSVTAPVMPCAA